jgi:hypothetical protein
LEQTNVTFVQRIVKDLQRGENIDLYVTIVAGVIATVLSLTNVITQTSVVPIVLALLSLMAFSLLYSRHGMNTLLERTSSRTDSVIHEDFPPEFQKDLERARDIWIVGVHASDIMTRYHSLVERKLESGDRVRAMLVDPGGAASSMTALRFPGQVDATQERARINSSLASLCRLHDSFPDSIEVRVVDFLFPYGGLLLDWRGNSGVAYLQRYTFRVLGGSRKPKLVYRRGAPWYDLILTEMEEFWKVARDWQSA